MIRTDDLDATLPPACRPTTERLQRVLDGELASAALDADSHVPTCAACAQRIATARAMLSILANPVDTALPPHLADRIVANVHHDRYARIRRQSYAVAAGLIAAGLVIWVSLTSSTKRERPVPLASDLVGVLRVSPEPHPAPEPRPVRIGDELSKVGLALLDSSRPITEPAIAAPQVFAKITGALTRPAGPAAEFGPTRAALADLPDAARSGLEPVTGTARKAFSRLMHDIGTVQVSTKPKP